MPAAPRLVRVQLSADGAAAAVEEFAAGWQTGAAEGTRWGRPVDVALGPDGNLYVSDDHANAIYQLIPPR